MRPFSKAHEELNAREGVGLGVCWFTLWAGLLFWQPDVDSGLLEFVTVAIVLMNAGYILWMLWGLARALWQDILVYN